MSTGERSLHSRAPEHRRRSHRADLHPAPAGSIFCLTSLRGRRGWIVSQKSLPALLPISPPPVKRISFLLGSPTSFTGTQYSDHVCSMQINNKLYFVNIYIFKAKIIMMHIRCVMKHYDANNNSCMTFIYTHISAICIFEQCAYELILRFYFQK